MRVPVLVVAVVLAATASACGGGGGSPPTTALPDTSHCTSKELQISIGEAGAALGHFGAPPLFRNVGNRSCELSGYPEVIGVEAAGGAVVPARHSLAGYLGGIRAASPPTVTLAYGEVASALIEATNVPEGDAESCPEFERLRVSPPGDPTSTKIDVSFYNCSGIEVHPVVPGSTGSDH